MSINDLLENKSLDNLKLVLDLCQIKYFKYDVVTLELMLDNESIEFLKRLREIEGTETAVTNVDKIFVNVITDGIHNRQLGRSFGKSHQIITGAKEIEVLKSIFGQHYYIKVPLKIFKIL